MLITGSTSGIGEAFASKFQLEGYNLILVGRNEEKLKAQVEKFSKYCDVKYIACELTSENAVDTIVDNLNKWDIKVDILINNVGFNRVGLFNEIPINDELEMVQLHIAMFLRLTKVCLKGMIENNYGYIVNLGFYGFIYCITFRCCLFCNEIIYTFFYKCFGRGIRRNGS